MEPNLLTKPAVSILSLTFSGGETFNLKSDEKIILVGANNSGKSQSLREILNICGVLKKEKNVVVTDVEIAKTGDSRDLRKFLDANAELIDSQYRYQSWQVHESFLPGWDNQYLPRLAGGFIKNIGPDERLRICDQQASIALGAQKSKPQHVLYDDEILMKK